MSLRNMFAQKFAKKCFRKLFFERFLGIFEDLEDSSKNFEEL